LCLRQLTTLELQRYFSAMAGSKLQHESRDKIRDVLSSILGSAVRYQLPVKNPMEGVQLPAELSSFRASSASRSQSGEIQRTTGTGPGPGQRPTP
jgi:hypothetical protein